MKIQVIQTLPNGQVTQQVLSKVGSQALKIQVQPGAKLSFNVEGGKSGDRAKAEESNIKKVGNNLVLESEGEALLEVTDFYSTAGTSVGNVTWNYAATDSGVMAATPEAQAVSGASASGSGALLPTIAPGWLMAGGAALAVGGAAGGAAKTEATVPTDNAPSAVTFANTVASISETAVNTSGTKLADINIVDADGYAGGSPTVSDSANFEVRTVNGKYELWLKSGSSIDYETVLGKAYSTTVTAGGTTSQAFEVKIADVNEAPKASGSISAQTAVKNQSAWSLNLASAFSDVDAGDTRTYTLTSGILPTGLSLNTSTGVISGTPTGESASSSYTVTMTDKGGLSATQTFNLTVGSADVPSVPSNIVSGVIVAGPVVSTHGLSVEMYQADGTTSLGTAAVDPTGKFSKDVGSYTGVIIAKVVDSSSGSADYADESSGLDVDLNATLMAVGVMSGGALKLNINPLTSIAAQKAGLLPDGTGSVATATAATEANAAVAKAFGLPDITETDPDTTNDSVAGTNAIGATLATLSGVDAQKGSAQETINYFVANITQTGAVGKLSDVAQETALKGAAVADTAGTFGLANKLSDSISASVTTTSFSVGDVATDNIIKPADALSTSTTITGTVAAGTTQASLDLKIGGTASNNNAGFTLVGTTWTYTLSAADVTALTAGADGPVAIELTVGGNTQARRMVLKELINDAPTAVTFLNPVTSISETAVNSSGTKLADINIADLDGYTGGSPTLSDTTNFEVKTVNGKYELWLKSGISIDYETVPGKAYSTTVTAGGTTSLAFGVSITNVNEPGSIAAITGTATQGQVLTAGTITDADGGVTGITYQWKADGTNISGATSSTYTLTQAEVGKVITVMASYTDAQGPSKSVTSAATSAVVGSGDQAGSIAVITGTATQGQVLTAGAITDADGGVTGTTYQWKADNANISGATSSTYTLTQAEVGKVITVVASYTDAHGSGKSATSAATSAVANIDDLGAIAAITGMATQGQVLTAGTITDADGGVTSITYQWKADGNNVAANGNASTYTLTQADVGKVITVVASYTDNHGAGKSATSTATSAVVASTDQAGSIAAITGTATQGQVLTAGAITDADGGVTGTTYQWKADGANINGATSSTYTLTQAEVGKAITVEASYTDNHGAGKSAISAATSTVANIDDLGTIAAITGTATQGQVLTAGAITDADGGVTSITYQWKADNANISGATSSTYTLTQAEVGKVITVVASYTDALGPNKNVTSTATATVADIDDLGAIATITGTATQGQVLTAGAITDPDGAVSGISYQWKADGTNISGATSSTYTLTQAEVGKAITVAATYTDALGPNKSVTSTATATVADIDDLGAIATITGTARQGQVLTAGTITDADGGVISITYQWKADGTNISGATSSTYTLTQAEVGKAITVEASYTDAHGSDKSATSAATSAVANIEDLGSIAAITGTATQGQVLTAGTITDADGGVTGITYQWKADGTNISGATSNTYTLTQSEVGKAITVAATYTDALGPNKSVTSTATATVADIDDLGAIATITGTATQGQVLTAGAITDPDGAVSGISYQWKADGTNISGATSSTYTLTQAEVGKAITVEASYTDAQGPSKSATSAATSAVANIEDLGSIAAITGTATQGQVLTAGTITDADGGVTGTTYQWKADGNNISGATSNTYTLTQAEVGKAITVAATYTDALGPNKSVTSTATANVADIDDLGAIAAITGTATQGQVLTAGTITDPDGAVSGISYQWKAGGIDIAGATSSTYTLTQAEVGKAITVVATYTDPLGSGKTATSTATNSVISPNDSAGTIGNITGTATQGETLTAGTVTDSDGSVTGISYQWRAADIDIAGATSSTYTLTQAEVGKAITVVASYTDALGPNKSATSTATSAVANIDDLGTIAAITGISTQGQVLTAGTITDADGGVTGITYQWKADNANISGATSSTYTLTQAEVGKAITVVASYTDAQGGGKSATSVATSAVANIDDLGTIAAITGTATQGQVLTAGAITDADGGVTSITYQWKADGNNVAANGNASTYTLTQADVGKAITVEASYTDNHGAGKSATSTATSAVANIDDLGTIAAITGTATQGQVLTAGAITDADGGVTSITYQWKADGNNVAANGNASTYTLTQTDVGKVITVEVSYTDNHGSGKSVTSAATSAVANIDDLGSIGNITGTATQGQVLTAGTVTDPDGSVSSTTYQWKADNANISGATSSTYTLTQAEVGKVITVVATYTDPLGGGKTATSAATAAVADFDDLGTIAAISGTATQGQVLTAGAVTDPDGAVSGISYQWKAGGIDIAGATSSTYTLTQVEVGKAITVVASYTDPLGSGKTATSAATAAVADIDDLGTIAAITGTATQGQVLTAGAITDADGGVTGTTYQWKADGNNVAANGNASTYTLTQADVGKVITVEVSYTDNHGSGKSVTSAATSAVANVNDAPTVANAIADQSATEDSVFSYVIPANAFADADNDTLSYSASGLPAGLIFDAGTRTISGTPTAPGTSTVTITANDGNGGTVTDQFTITVANVNDAPTVANAIADQSATEDTAFSYQIPANAFADADNDTLSYSASGLPAGLSFDTGTRTISGTPTAPGTSTVTITAIDGNGGTVTDEFTITVANVNDAPTVANAIADQSATEDTAFSYQIPANAFADADNDTLSYSASGLPAGLSFDTGTRTISGTPTAPGTSTVTITAIDGNGGTVTDEFTITVANVDDLGTIAAITGTATQGQVLTAGAITDADGGVTDTTYQWKANDINISGATSNTYTLTQAEVGKVITVVANYTDAQGPNKSATSVATSAVVASIDQAGSMAAITGTVTQGQVLTAGAITDADGGVTNIIYQWKADGTNISGATSSTYTLTQSEVGKVVSVVASYTDNHGSGKTVTAQADARKLGGTLSLGSGMGQLISGIQVEGNWYYYWDKDGSGGASVGDKMSMDALETAMFNNNVGNVVTDSNRTFAVNGLSLSLPTRGSSVVSGAFGTATTWSSATAGANTTNSNATYDDLFAIWDYVNGTSTVVNTFGNVTNKANLTTIGWADGDYLSSSVGPTAGRHYMVNASEGYNEHVSDASTGLSVAFRVNSTVVNVDDAGSLSITGTATQGQVLTAGTITDPDGGVSSITYQWKADGINVAANGTASTYTLTQADVGKAITVVASYTDNQGSGKSVISTATSAVTNIDDAGSLSITGTATQGQVLTAGTITDADGGVTGITYQWKADGTNINGATNNTYTLTQADVGKSITVVASYTDNQGSGKTVTSSQADARQAGVNIALGSGMGQLINGIQVEGKWYYYWDKDGSGNASVGDKMSMDALETTMFNSSSGNMVTDSNRTFSVGTTSLILPTRGRSTVSGYGSGTAWSNATPGASTTANSNTTYDDYFAIWDYLNGTGTASNGTATADLTSIGWVNGDYWSSSAGTSTDTHSRVNPSVGYNETLSDSNVAYAANVVFEVASHGLVVNIDDLGSIAAITGTATQGQVLTAGTITDADGGVTGTTYQWKADGTNISGATSNTYTLTQAEVGKAITVMASYTDAHGSGKSATSAATSAVAINAVSAPTFSSSIDNNTKFDVRSDIVLTASENVTAVAGKYIHIINDANAGASLGYLSEATVHTQDILVTDTTKLTISGNKITLNPGWDLDLGNNYHIEVDAGAFTGVTSGMASVAIADSTSMNFSTVSPFMANLASAMTSAVASEKMVAGTDAITASGSWFSVMGATAGIGDTSTANAGAIFDLAGGNYVILGGKDTSTVPQDINLSESGLSLPFTMWVELDNFGLNDSIYIDDQFNNVSYTNLIEGDPSAVAEQTATLSRIAVPASNGQGWFDVVLASEVSIAKFNSIAELSAATNNQAVLVG